MSYFHKLLCLYLTTSSFVYAMEDPAEKQRETLTPQARTAPMGIVASNSLGSNIKWRRENAFSPHRFALNKYIPQGSELLEYIWCGYQANDTSLPFICIGVLVEAELADNTSELVKEFGKKYADNMHSLFIKKAFGQDCIHEALHIINKHLPFPEWMIVEICEVMRVENPFRESSQALNFKCDIGLHRPISPQRNMISALTAMLQDASVDSPSRQPEISFSLNHNSRLFTDNSYPFSFPPIPDYSPPYSPRPPYLSDGVPDPLSLSVSNNIPHSTLIFHGGYLTAPGALPSSASPSISLSLLNKHISAPNWRADEISRVRGIETSFNNQDEHPQEYSANVENMRENTAFHQKALKLIVKINNDENMLFHEETPQFLLMGKLRKFSPKTLDRLLLQPKLLEFLRLSSRENKLRMLSALAKFPEAELDSLLPPPLDRIFARISPQVTKHSALSLFFNHLLDLTASERLDLLKTIVTLLNNDKPRQAGDFIDANTLLAILDILGGIPEQKRAALVSSASSFIQNISDPSLIPTILLDLSEIDRRHYHMISQLLKPWPKFFYNPKEERHKFFQMITELVNKGDLELIKILSQLFKDEFKSASRQHYGRGIELANICKVTRMLIPVASQDRQLLLRYAPDYIDSKVMSASTDIRRFISTFVNFPPDRNKAILNTFEKFFADLIILDNPKSLQLNFLEKLRSLDQVQQDKLISFMNLSTANNKRQFSFVIGFGFSNSTPEILIDFLIKLPLAEWPIIINCLKEIQKDPYESQPKNYDLICKIDGLSTNHRLLLTSYPHLVRPLLTTLDRSLTNLEAVAPEDREDVLQALFALWQKKPSLGGISDQVLERLSKLTSQERSIFLNYPKLDDWLRTNQTLKMLYILTNKTQFGFIEVSELIEELARLEEENLYIFTSGVNNPVLLMKYHFLIPGSKWYYQILNHWRTLLDSSDERVVRDLSELIITHYESYYLPPLTMKL
ncbi:hypothetical protein [Candidatus Odyssella thessalonicensis]|uniref:hypothetical protein n=1 Tax=Candidatus Odyssella thessalonicensis TaxID=84647 RepID=UPI000225B16B|nr:hypothetical protein [Candidatus Odyssella thessalonicensis]